MALADLPTVPLAGAMWPLRAYVDALSRCPPSRDEVFPGRAHLPDPRRHRAYVLASLYRRMHACIAPDVRAGHAILDLGAWPGTFLRLCRNVFWPGVPLRLVGAGLGVDFERPAAPADAADGLRATSDVLRDEQIEFLSVDLDGCTAGHATLPTAERFDVITCMEVIEHLHTPYRLAHLLATLLKPGGVCVVETNNVAYLAGALRLVFTRRSNLDFMLAEYTDPTHDANAGHPHVRFYSVEEVAHILRRQGLRVERAETFYWLDTDGAWAKNTLKRILRLCFPGKAAYLVVKARKPSGGA